MSPVVVFAGKRPDCPVHRRYDRLVVGLFALLLAALICPVLAQGIEPSATGRFTPKSDHTALIKLQRMELNVTRAQEMIAKHLSSRLVKDPGVSRKGREYIIVQFDGPITEDQRYALESYGARIYEYIPDYAFLVGISAGLKQSLRQIPGYLGSVPYLPGFKFMFPNKPKRTDKASKADALVETCELTIIGFAGEDLFDLTADLKNMGVLIASTSETPLKIKIMATVPLDLVEDIAALPSVRWIEESPEFKASNNLVANGAECNVRDAWDTHGLRGSGMIVAVADSGLDRGSTNPDNLNNDFEDGSESSRVTAIFDVNDDGDTSDTNGHGTHVSGSVLGNGANSGSDPNTHTYPSTCYAGMAPEASLVFQSIGDSTPYFNLPADLNTLFDQARGSNAWIHTNSWGASAVSSYTSFSQDVDENIWTNRNFCILFSAGNEGVDWNRDGVIDFYSIGAPGTAKNCITVGASEHIRSSGGFQLSWGVGWPDAFSENPIKDDHPSNTIGGMAAFSSRGPCIDGRRKPDIVAPGSNIISVRSAVGGGLWGGCGANYSYSGGTSMSTPLVAGMAALTREFFVNGNCPGISSPSAALIKATLLNGATDISPGQYGTGATKEIPARPNNVEGWGLANLNDALFDNGQLKHLFADNISGVNTGDEIYYDVNVASGALPLRVNLVWTDAPGSLAHGGGLVNDLDLNVINPDGMVIYPTNASKGGPSSVMSNSNGLAAVELVMHGGNESAVKFTPQAYPYVVDAARFGVTLRFSYGFWNVIVRDDDGPNGMPGAILTQAKGGAKVNGTYNGINIVPLSPVTITSGSFYISMQGIATYANLNCADSPRTVGNDYTYNISQNTWENYVDDDKYDFIIDAIGHYGSITNQNDRVNNVEGVAISAPTPGIYRIRVQGYNVPVGPQPYALAIIGDTTNRTASVTSITSNTPNGSYKAGAVIDIKVNFDHPVTVSGMPKVRMGTGSAIAYAYYTSGSGTSILTFTYVVGPEDTSADLDCASTTAIEMNGGNIHITGMCANLTMPAPGSVGSLSYNKNLVIDNTPPVVASINRQNPSGQYTNTNCTWRVTFSEAVSLVDISDFAVTKTGGIITSYSVASVSTVNTSAYDVAVNTGAGDGVLRLDVPSFAIIRDVAGNAQNTGYASGQTYTVEKTPPTVLSVNRQAPASQFTNGSSSVTWRVTFSESVTGVAVGCFAVGKVSGGISGYSVSMVTVVTGNPTAYDVTANVGTGEGELRLDVLSASTTLYDTVGNKYNSNYVSSQTYIIDRTRPIVMSVNRQNPAEQYANGTSVTWRAAFSEAVMGVAASDFSITKVSGSISVYSVTSVNSVDAARYDVTVALGSGDGVLRLDVPATATIDDLAANQYNTAYVSGQTYTIDRVRPMVVSVNRQSPTGQYTKFRDGLWRVTFNKPVGGVDYTDFNCTPIWGNLSGSRVTSATAVNTSTYDVSGKADSGEGEFRLDVATSATIYDLSNSSNTLTGGYTSGQTYVIDTVAPTVTSVVRQSLSPQLTNASSVIWRVTFSESVTGVNNSSFSFTTVSGAITGCFVSAVSQLNASTYNVTVNTGSGDGEIRLDVSGNLIYDYAYNKYVPLYLSGQTYIVDKTLPIVVSATRYAPGGQTTASGQVTWRVTFSETITDLTSDDFTATVISGAIMGSSAVSVTPVSGSVYDVTVNTGTGDGEIRADLPASATIYDAAGNVYSANYQSGETYILDRTAPTVVSISRYIPGAKNTSSASVVWRVVFTEEVSNLDASDFLITKLSGSIYGCAVTKLSRSSDYKVYDVTVSTVTGEGEIRLDLPSSSVLSDLVGNAYDSDFQAGETYVIDRTLPTVLNITRRNPTKQKTNAQSIVWRVVFSEPVTDVDNNDFTIAKPSGGSVWNYSVSSVSAVDSSTYDVTVNTGTGNGEIRLDVLAAACIPDFAGNDCNSDYQSGQTYIMDKTLPYAMLLSANPWAAKLDTSILIYFRATEALDATPQVKINDQDAWCVSNTDLDYEFAYTVQSSDPDGQATVRITLLDLSGNVNTQNEDGLITVDNTAPTIPGTPTDAGAFTTNTSIIFNWTSSTDSAGIGSYNCRIGITPDGNEVFDGNLGNVLTKIITGSNGNTYYCHVQAVDVAGNSSDWTPSSDGILVHTGPVTESVSAAKMVGNGAHIVLSAKTVTATFGDIFYIEDSGRTCGIRVDRTGHGLTAGVKADITGTLETNADYERFIIGNTTSQNGAGTLDPLMLINRALGGGDWHYSQSSGAGQKCITNAVGLNNIGLLVSATGRVTYSTTGYFYIDDGSGSRDDSAYAGVKVLGSVPGPGDPIGRYVKVTGISSCFRASLPSAYVYRRILATGIVVIQQ